MMELERPGDEKKKRLEAWRAAKLGTGSVSAMWVSGSEAAVDES